MKKTKNYLLPELAKTKISRYRYWNIKDEHGITITSSDDVDEDTTFDATLDNIINQNVDAEVQVRFGINEPSSRHNPPYFIRINQEVEWVDPEESETVSINGVSYPADKNGNVNINLKSPMADQANNIQRPIIEQESAAQLRLEMDMQLQGLRREQELKDEKHQLIQQLKDERLQMTQELKDQRHSMEMQQALAQQKLEIKEMLLDQRETAIAEKEQNLAIKEQELDEKEEEITKDLKGYLKHVPNALGGVIKDFFKDEDDGGDKDKNDLKGTGDKKEDTDEDSPESPNTSPSPKSTNKSPKAKRTKVEFSFEPMNEEQENNSNKELKPLDHAESTDNNQPLNAPKAV